MTELMQSVYRKYRDENRLYAAMVELTWKCQCRCIHCYIDERKCGELSTAETVGLLDQMKDEGIIDLGFTGGEVFLRKDLPTVIEETHARGFIFFLLTNGILIDETAADMLKKNGAHHVEMSLMGSCAETHDSIMRHPGAFDKTLQAVRLLRERNITVVLKNSVLRRNVEELEKTAALAEKEGALFNASVSILPTTAGSSGPQSLAIDFDTAARLDRMLTGSGLIPGEDGLRGAMLECNAGRTNCGISPDGDVYPCLIWRRPVGNIRTDSLKNIWHEKTDPYLETIRRTKPEQSSVCFICTHRDSCRRCPGMAWSETGDFRSPAYSACMLAGKKEGPAFRPDPLTVARSAAAPAEQRVQEGNRPRRPD